MPETAQDLEAPDFLSPPSEESPNLNEMRYLAVLQALATAEAKTVIDLGCGEGKLPNLAVLALESEPVDPRL